MNFKATGQNYDSMGPSTPINEPTASEGWAPAIPARCVPGRWPMVRKARVGPLTANPLAFRDLPLPVVHTALGPLPAHQHRTCSDPAGDFLHPHHEAERVETRIPSRAVGHADPFGPGHVDEKLFKFARNTVSQFQAIEGHLRPMSRIDRRTEEPAHLIEVGVHGGSGAVGTESAAKDSCTVRVRLKSVQLGHASERHSDIVDAHPEGQRSDSLQRRQRPELSRRLLWTTPTLFRSHPAPASSLDLALPEEHSITRSADDLKITHGPPVRARFKALTAIP
jgi:hypothetical protein